MQVTPKHIKSRWTAAQGERRKFAQTLNTVSHYFVPGQSNMWQGKSADRLANPFGFLFDNTGVKAATSIANKAVSRVIPKNSQYADIKLAAPLAAQLPATEREQWDARLRIFSDVLHSVLERGGFRKALKRAAKDYLVLGHGAIRPYVAETGAIVFDHFPAASVYLENYAGREYSGCFWQLEMTIRNIKAQFPFAELPKGSGFNDDDKKNIVFGFLPGTDSNEEFAFIDAEDILLYHRPLFSHERSVVASAFNNKGGDAYGEGFGVENVGEVQSLNQMRVDSLRLSKLHSTPMFVAADGALKNENISARPGAIIKVTPDPDAGGISGAFQPLQIGGRPDVMFGAMEESRNMVREGFNSMPGAANPRNAVRTATEWIIAQRQEQMESDEVNLALRDDIVIPAIKQTAELLRQQAKAPEWLVIEDETFRLEMQGMEEESKQATDLAHLNALWEMSRNMPPEQQAVAVPNLKMFRKAAKIFKQEDILLTTEEMQAQLTAMAQARAQAAAQAQQQGGA